MAGILFNCFVTNRVQPAQTVTLSTEAAPATIGLQGPAAESTSVSPPNFASSFPVCGRNARKRGTLSIPTPMRGVAGPVQGQAECRPRGTTKVKASKFTARERGRPPFSRRCCLDNGAKPIARRRRFSPGVPHRTWRPGLQRTPFSARRTASWSCRIKTVQVFNPGTSAGLRDPSGSA